MKRTRGFSLLETLLYLGIFAIVGGALFGILTNVVRISTKEVSGDEVSTQLNFAMSTINRLVRESSNIETATTTATTTLKLRMSDPLKDPTCITFSGGKLKLAQGPDAFQKQNCTATTTDITTDKVVVDSALFKKLEFPGGRDQVTVDMQFSNLATGAAKISRALRSGISRVSAATFDSDLLPNTDAQYEVGFASPSTKRWKNISISNLLNLGVISSDPAGIDGSIYYNSTSKKFRGRSNGTWNDLDSSLWLATSTHMYSNVTGNVGIGTATPGSKLDVNGAAEFNAIYKISPNSNNPERGEWNALWTAIGAGRAVYVDEEFALGTNSVSVYNNAGGTGVQHFWENGDGSQPNQSGKWIRIVNNGSATSPGLGGFYQSIASRRNATFAQRFRAKLPVGYTLNIAENAQGSNNTSYWLTSTAGTGKWEEYVRVSHAGNTGTFSTGGHVYVTGPSATFTWYLASSNIYEVDSPSGIFSGSVGIGTASPTEKLDVVGNIQSSGDIYANGGSFWGDDKAIVTFSDTWLRLNPSNGFTSGIYAGTGILRTDGPLQVGGNGATFLVSSAGNVGIGVTGPTYKLQVNGDSANTTGVWAVSSDARLKSDIAPIGGALKIVTALRGVGFNWRDEAKDKKYGRVMGFIAQDVERVLPQWVKTGEDGYKRIETIGMDALLVEAIKEQQQQIESLKAEVAGLKNR